MYAYNDEVRAQIANMHQPVRCNRCRGVYDLGTVTVTARYADCSVWRTPCCDQSVDDRGHTGWTSRKDYEYIDKANPDAGRVNEFGVISW